MGTSRLRRAGNCVEVRSAWVFQPPSFLGVTPKAVVWAVGGPSISGILPAGRDRRPARRLWRAGRTIPHSERRGGRRTERVPVTKLRVALPAAVLPTGRDLRAFTHTFWRGATIRRPRSRHLSPFCPRARPPMRRSQQRHARRPEPRPLLGPLGPGHALPCCRALIRPSPIHPQILVKSQAERPALEDGEGDPGRPEAEGCWDCCARLDISRREVRDGCSQEETKAW